MAQITNILQIVEYKHLNIALNIQKLEPSKVSLNPVHLFMH